MHISLLTLVRNHSNVILAELCSNNVVVYSHIDANLNSTLNLHIRTHTGGEKPCV